MKSKLAAAWLICGMIYFQARTAPGTIYRDDFSYSHDLALGVPGFVPGTTTGGGIWNGVVNAGAGGSSTAADASTGKLSMGMSGVGWENENDSGPFLWRLVNIADLRSVTVRIDSQTRGNWSHAGILVREPNPIDNQPLQENWNSAVSFRSAFFYDFQRNRVINSSETESDERLANAATLEYLRLENLGVEIINFGSMGTIPGRRFQVLRSADGENWIPHSNASIPDNANPNLVSGTVQVGVWAGAFGVLADSTTKFDWVEMDIVPEPNSFAVALLAVCGATALHTPSQPQKKAALKSRL